MSKDQYTIADSTTAPTVRLAALDATRATEQTAIFMGMLAAFGDGRFDLQKPTKRKEMGAYYATEPLLGYLAHMYCAGRTLHFEDFCQTERISDVHAALHGRNGRFGVFSKAGGAWDMDFIACPIDGNRAYLSCLNEGTICALVAAPPGSILPQDTIGLCDDYIVVTGRRGMFSDLESAARSVIENCAGIPVATSAEYHNQVLVKICASVSVARPTVATAIAERDNYVQRVVVPALQRLGRVRAFNGSSIAAGLCAMIPRLGIDIAVVHARRTQALMLGVGAAATGADYCAIPFADSVTSLGTASDALAAMRTTSKPPADVVIPFKSRPRQRTAVRMSLVVVGGSSKLLLRRSVVLDPRDVFLVATGIGETSLLKGVRFYDGHFARTQSLCLRSHGESIRVIEHRQDIAGMPLRLIRRTGALDKVLAHLNGCLPITVEYARKN